MHDYSLLLPSKTYHEISFTHNENLNYSYLFPSVSMYVFMDVCMHNSQGHCHQNPFQFHDINGILKWRLIPNYSKNFKGK